MARLISGTSPQVRCGCKCVLTCAVWMPDLSIIFPVSTVSRFAIASGPTFHCAVATGMNQAGYEDADSGHFTQVVWDATTKVSLMGAGKCQADCAPFSTRCQRAARQLKLNSEPWPKFHSVCDASGWLWQLLLPRTWDVPRHRISVRICDHLPVPATGAQHRPLLPCMDHLGGHAGYAALTGGCGITARCAAA
jgi:hypothetical protein